MNGTAPAFRSVTGLRAHFHRRARLNFAIIGAEKAGTTALFAYLRRVPGIYMPVVKELCFFDREQRYRDGSDFSRLHMWFAFAPRGAILGDATPTYLMHPYCLRRIYDYNPDIKVIAILRSPVRRAYSAWNYRRARLRDKRDFLTAVRVEVESAGDVAVARENKYRYVGAGYYAEQIRAVRRVFPPENLMLLKYEDFDRDQIGHVCAAARFVGASDVPTPRLRRVNVWRYPRPISEAEFYEVLAHYADEIAEVEALTGWDCSDWRTFRGRGKKRALAPDSGLAAGVASPAM